jgi:hypothetical protein
MSNKIVIGFGALLTTMILFNMWSMARMDARMAAWEQGIISHNGVQNSPETTSAQATNSVVSTSSALRNGMSGKPSRIQAIDAGSDSPIDLENPDVREAIARIVEDDEIQRKEVKREEQMAMYLDSMNREVAAFAEENNLDQNTRRKVTREIELRTQAWTAVKDEAHDGDISWFDARAEFKAIKEESETNLRDILGDDRFESLNSRLWGGWGKRH